jgi:hypothetical protein
MDSDTWLLRYHMRPPLLAMPFEKIVILGNEVMSRPLPGKWILRGQLVMNRRTRAIESWDSVSSAHQSDLRMKLDKIESDEAFFVRSDEILDQTKTLGQLFWTISQASVQELAESTFNGS